MLLSVVRSRIGREWNDFELGDIEALKMQQPHDPDDDQDVQVDQAGKLENLRTIIEKVERKAHVPADNPDVVALKIIVEDKIARLESRLPLKKTD